MKIILDAFGGDHAPLAPLQGAEMAIKEYGVEIIAVGDVAKMEALCQERRDKLKVLYDLAYQVSQ